MKFLLVLTDDKGNFITQVGVAMPQDDLELTPEEFSFRHCVWNRAIEALQADARLDAAVKRFGGVICHSSLSVN